ncbi:hypothetical protein J7S78_14185 [Klebsiella oxytoca]|uniref:Uncharacterized protein n=1 Tax=Klebsiella oxytoca TaxID=571 RepID=A0AAP2FLR6_KLEOX|nr:hypothetical protein [Klebsiella oxytoca]MBQ0600944.1 hypothetical protein [Klebsiella oxytoca]
MANRKSNSDNVDLLALPKCRVVSLLLSSLEFALRDLSNKRQSLPVFRRNLAARLFEIADINTFSDDKLKAIINIPATKFKTCKAANITLNERIAQLRELLRALRSDKTGNMYVI